MEKYLELYKEINFNSGKVTLSREEDNFKEIFKKKGQHLYLTSYSYDMPTEYYSSLLENIEFINDIKVIFNIYDFGSTESAKVDLLIKKSLSNNPYIQFFYCRDNHSKIISNGDILYIGSANVTKYTKNNFEAGVLIYDKETIEQVERYVFEDAYLMYEPIFTDPIAPIIVPFHFIISEMTKELDEIESLLKSVDRRRFVSESDLPDYGKDLKEYLSRYETMFKIAINDLDSFITDNSDEYYIVVSLLDEIEKSLKELLTLEPIGSETRRFFDFIEEYQHSMCQYKEHSWRTNTIENEVVINKERVYLSRAKVVLELLQILRVKWISLIKNDKYKRYEENKTIKIVWWYYNLSSREDIGNIF